MKEYFKKYSILLIVIIGFLGLLKFTVVKQLQVILMNYGIELNEALYIQNTVLINIPYLINLILAGIILSDIKKNKIKGIPVVLVTMFSYLAGVIFFFFLLNNKINANDK